MGLIWHIVKKDCLHLRWLLAASLTVLGAQIALGIWAEGGSETPFQAGSEIALANWILFWLQLLVAILLTVEIVHGDLLVDPKVHWLTLPISGAQLLIGKLATVILLVWLLPVVVLWPWWLAHHWSATDLILGTAILVFLHALVTLPALLIATLTDSWSRFVTWAFVGVVLVGAAVVLLQIHYEAIPLEIRPPPTAPWSQLVTGGSLMGVVLAAAVLNQYLTRRRSLSLFVVSIGGLVAMLAATSSHTDFIMPVADRMAGESLPEAHLKMNLGPISGGSNQREYIGLDVDGTFGVTDGDRVYGRLLDFGWKWPNGGVWKRSSRGVATNQSFFASRASLDSQENDPELFRRQNVIYSLGTPAVPAYVSQKLRSEPAEFRARAEVAIIHPEILAAVSLQPGNRFGRGTERFKIISFERRKGFPEQEAMAGHEVLTELGALVMIETQSWLRANLQGMHRFPAVSFQSFIFSNLVEQGGVQGQINRSGNLSSRQVGPFAGVLVSRYDGVIDPPRKYFPDRPLTQRLVVLDPHWIDSLKMYWTESRPIARGEAEFVEPHFVTREETPNQSPTLRAPRTKR